MKKSVFILAVALLLGGCVNLKSESNSGLQAGMYRGYLQRPDGIAIVFNFQVTDSGGKKTIYIINGKEHMRVDSIIEKHRHFRIEMPFFDNEFDGLALNDGSLQGKWIRHLADSDQAFFFRALPNEPRRFDLHHSPLFNITGRWATHFIETNREDSSFSVGEFEQKGDTVTGTFLNTDGDDRFLQGIVDGDSLKLSTFDGSHAYLFTAKINNDSTITGGHFYAGYKGFEYWDAQKNVGAQLPNAFSLTTVKPGENHIDFTFPDLNKDSVSLHDFLGKVVIVQIMGSWCPNCMDETAFLSRFYNKNKNRSVQVVALAYERTTNFDRSKSNLMDFKRRFNVQYPMLITGVTDDDPNLMAKTLPQIQHFQAFPTTIFVNKKGDIAKINTGFSGPGTGEHFIVFKKEFNHLVDSLLSSN
jgi:thiol-disulfide isomerase/thioredoxin